MVGSVHEAVPMRTVACSSVSGSRAAAACASPRSPAWSGPGSWLLAMDQVWQADYDRGAMLRSVASSAAALRQVFANGDLRRAELAWLTALASEWAWLVALFVFAFETGGVGAV